VLRLGGQKSPWLVSAADLAELIDRQRLIIVTFATAALGETLNSNFFAQNLLTEILAQLKTKSTRKIAGGTKLGKSHWRWFCWRKN
jgi:hypothetical protein